MLTYCNGCNTNASVVREIKITKQVAGLFNRMCAQVALSGECLRGENPPDRMLAIPWRRLFLAAYTLWAKPGCCCCPA